MLEDVERILVECLNLNYDDITIDSRLKEDLKIDSLDFVELLSEVENQFKIKVPNDKIKKLVTVNDIVNLISSKK